METDDKMKNSEVQSMIDNIIKVLIVIEIILLIVMCYMFFSNA